MSIWDTAKEILIRTSPPLQAYDMLTVSTEEKQQMVEDDFNVKSWYEWGGFFQSPAEQQYQDLQRVQFEANLLKDQQMKTQDQVYQMPDFSAFRQQTVPTTFNKTSLGLGVAAAGALALVLLARR